MQDLATSKLDALLSLSSSGSVQDETEAFLATDTSNIEVRPALHKRIMRILKGKKHTVLKAVLISALAAVLLALSACACIPEVREYFWKITTIDRGDHAKVEFQTEEKSDTEELTTIEPNADEITHIKQKMQLSVVPKGLVKGDDETLMMGQYHVNYYTSEGEWGMTVSQFDAKTNEIYVDNEHSTQITVMIKGNQALLLEEPYSGRTFYYLTWTDGTYNFSITGIFDSVTEVVQVAEGIELEEAEP